MTSLYRRHRPQTFDEVVGQAPIVRTMRNAVDHDKVHHAYLFVGSRTRSGPEGSSLKRKPQVPQASLARAGQWRARPET